MAESSGRQFATGPVGERGYWQINTNHASLSTSDPLGNARASSGTVGEGPPKQLTLHNVHYRHLGETGRVAPDARTRLTARIWTIPRPENVEPW